MRRGLRIALDAAGEYAMFLALGLAALIAFEMLLISGGVLGAIPLSGVVSPFLSSGNTAMLANFLIAGILLAISNHPREAAADSSFRGPVRSLELVLGLCAVTLLGFAAYYQVARDREFLARDTKVFEDDGVKRAQHNPRLNSLAHEIRRGDIFDRNGILLATSDWNELEQRRDQYDKLGVSIDAACSRLDNRHYPFGSLTAHLLGDLRTGENFHATNASLVEHDSNVKLQGFTDYRELAPLVRYRHQPGNPDIARLMARDRNVTTSLDIRLQMRVAKALEDRLAKAHKEKGAAIVMDPHTGDVLALVSEPAHDRRPSPRRMNCWIERAMDSILLAPHLSWSQPWQRFASTPTSRTKVSAAVVCRTAAPARKFPDGGSPFATTSAIPRTER